MTVEEKLVVAESALREVGMLIYCTSVTMGGKSFFKFSTSRQDEVAHKVIDAIAAIGDFPVQNYGERA